ncbi:hypothetical protein B0A55_08420 [Friedmanniomyces simplex]|uniref:Uncharacterized protein n=1 Tax=Friedmanniomyces simplex TaxID=329884 RepID=A0A4U0WUM0_9PEZI|nr:hypothetical protein B0A55_08420 [Friedmanniomyces simplex]
MFVSGTLTTFLFALSASAFPFTSNHSLASVYARTSCTAGAIVCNGPTQFALCNPPQPLVFQPVAAGMVCSGDQMIQNSAGRLAGGSNTGSIPGIAYGTSAPSAALPPLDFDFHSVSSYYICSSDIHVSIHNGLIRLIIV